MVKQVFIWSFKVIDCGSKSEGENLLLNLLKYLQLTTSSMHYITLSCEVIMCGEQPLIKSIIPVTLAAQRCKELTKSALQLLWAMMSGPGFKVRLLTCLFELYNSVEDF